MLFFLKALNTICLLVCLTGTLSAQFEHLVPPHDTFVDLLGTGLRSDPAEYAFIDLTFHNPQTNRPYVYEIDPGRLVEGSDWSFLRKGSKYKARVNEESIVGTVLDIEYAGMHFHGWIHVANVTCEPQLLPGSALCLHGEDESDQWTDAPVMEALSPREQFSFWLSAYHETFWHPGLDTEKVKVERRQYAEHLISMATRLQPPPAIPENARKELIKGATVLQLENGQPFDSRRTWKNLDDAESAFRSAILDAPWWPDAYFNHAKVCELQGDTQGMELTRQRNEMEAQITKLGNEQHLAEAEIRRRIADNTRSILEGGGPGQLRFWDEAIQDYQLYLKANPSDARATQDHVYELEAKRDSLKNQMQR